MSQRAGVHFGDCNNGDQMDNQPDSMPQAAIGRRFTVVRVVVITVIFVLVDKQTLMRFDSISKNTPYIAAEINATSNT